MHAHARNTHTHTRHTHTQVSDPSLGRTPFWSPPLAPALLPQENIEGMRRMLHSGCADVLLFGNAFQ